MLFYPGGTTAIHSTIGYMFWDNYFSDLGRTIAWNGASNTVSFWLFNIGLILWAIANGWFHFGAINTFQAKNDRISVQICLIFGLISSLLTIVVVFLPWDLYITPHLLAFLSALLAFVPCAFLYGRIIIRNSQISHNYGWIFIIFGFIIIMYVVFLYTAA